MTDYINEFFAASAPPAHQEHGVSKFDNVMLKDLPVTMAYVPMQALGRVYEPDGALQAGTLFEALDKPFFGKRV